MDVTLAACCFNILWEWVAFCSSSFRAQHGCDESHYLMRGWYPSILWKLFQWSEPHPNKFYIPLFPSSSWISHINISGVFFFFVVVIVEIESHLVGMDSQPLCYMYANELWIGQNAYILTNFAFLLFIYFLNLPSFSLYIFFSGAKAVLT